MSTERVEHNELIATRTPPGDRWVLVGDPKKQVFTTLTDTLEAFLHQTGFKGSYRLDPMDSKLYAIQEHEYEVPKDEPKTFSLYGEFKQGV
ncbi:hypothetical protein N9F64_01635 [bacterium]|jgi:hypothetical protein|nr:hypothetical protein [bacterium]